MADRLSILNYGAGNVWSIKNALNFLGSEVNVIDTPQEIIESNGLILPGVGSFRKSMELLKSKKFDQAIKEAVNKKKIKVIGICLGMQLLAKSSSEDGETEGLGLIPSTVQRFNSQNTPELKIPHIGFNKVEFEYPGTLFNGISNASFFYFAHSFKLFAENYNARIATCNYGEKFMASYEKDNIFAVQFHPEKSQTNGLMLLKNFINFNA